MMSDEELASAKCVCEFEQHDHSTEEPFQDCSKEQLIQQIQHLTTTVNTLLDEKQILQYQLEVQKYIIINNADDDDINQLTALPSVSEVTDFDDNDNCSKELPSSNNILHELRTDPFPSNVLFDEEDRDNSCTSEINSAVTAIINESNLLVSSSEGLEDSLQFEDLVESDWISRVIEVDDGKTETEFSKLHLEVIPYEIVPSVGEEQVVSTSITCLINGVCSDNDKTSLDSTIEKKTSSSDFQCHICSNSYKYHFSLKRHLSQQHNISSFACNRKSVPRKNIDKSDSDAVIVTNGKCSVTENQLKLTSSEDQDAIEVPSQLKKRRKRKKKVVNLICELCGQSFKYLYNYQRHVKKLHCENEEKYPCSICSKIFPSHKSLRRHQNDVHYTSPEDKHFQCHLCLELFKYHYLLQRHIGRVHELKNRVSCSQCSKTFATEYHLRRHLVLHQKNTSNIKGKAQGDSDTSSSTSSRSSSSIVRKRPRSHGDSFVCEFCGKVFPKKNRLVQHCVSHAEEKPFSCQLCEKSFTRKAKLLQHQLSRHLAEGTS